MAVTRPDKRTVFLALIARNLIIRGYKKPELAAKLSMSTASLYNRLKDPDTFTLGELRKLFKVLRFTEEEIKSVI